MKEPAYFHGYQQRCLTCRHRDGKVANQGHPSPCDRVRWENGWHRVPEWRGDECDDYQSGLLVGAT